VDDTVRGGEYGEVGYEVDVRYSNYANESFRMVLFLFSR
jgi:hypothetical protein